MANGFFLGGMAEGALGAQKMALAERTQTEDVGLRTRGLDLQEQQLANTVSQQAQAQADKQIAETMAVVSETIKNATAVGRDPAAIMKAVTPLVQSAQAIASRIGRDPNALAAQVQAQIASPGAVEAARTKGTATAAERVAEAHGIAAATGAGVDVNPFKAPEERVKLENALRDDYVARSKDFVTLRDFKDRIDNMPATGIGDVGLVFSFMKVLDPGSTVREGEFATAANAAGVPSAIRSVWNKLVGEGKLDPTGRKELREAAQSVFGTAAARHSNLTNQFAKIAKRQGLRVDNVIVDFTAGGSPTAGTTSTGIRWNWQGE